MGAFAGEFDSVKPVAPKHAAPLVLEPLVGKNAIDIGLRWSQFVLFQRHSAQTTALSM